MANIYNIYNLYKHQVANIYNLYNIYNQQVANIYNIYKQQVANIYNHYNIYNQQVANIYNISNLCNQQVANIYNIYKQQVAPPSALEGAVQSPAPTSAGDCTASPPHWSATRAAWPCPPRAWSMTRGRNWTGPPHWGGGGGEEERGGRGGRAAGQPVPGACAAPPEVWRTSAAPAAGPLVWDWPSPWARPTRPRPQAHRRKWSGR